MKKIVWLVVLASLAVVATAYLFIRHRIPYLTTHRAVARVKQSSPVPGMPDADWRDEKLWEQTPEYKAVTDEIERISKAGDAWDNLTSNEVEVLILNMHNPHYFARMMAVTAAGGDKYSASVKHELLPHVIGLLSDPVSHVRLWAADTLGRVGDKSVIPYLYPLLNDDRQVVRDAAQKAIHRLQGKEVVPGK